MYIATLLDGKYKYIKVLKNSVEYYRFKITHRKSPLISEDKYDTVKKCQDAVLCRSLSQ